MTPFTVATLLAFVVNLFLGVHVLMQQRERTANRLFSAGCILLAVVALSTFSLAQPISAGEAELWTRGLLVCASLAPPLFLHMTLELFGLSRKGLVVASYMVSAVLALCAVSGLLHTGLRNIPIGPEGHGWFFISGPQTLLLVVNAAAASLGSVSALLGFMRESTGIRRTQARYFVIALIPILAAGTHDLAAGLFDIYPAGAAVVPLTPVASAAWASGVAYLMRRYRLMDLETALLGGLVRTLTFLVMSAPFVFIIVAAEQAYLGSPAKGPFLLGTAIVCALAASMVRPLRQAANRKLDALFSPAGRDYREALVSFSRESTRMLELETLLERVVETLSATLGVRMAGVYIASLEEGFRLGAIGGAGGAKIPAQLSLDHPLIDALHDTTEPLVREELELGQAGGHDELVTQMNAHGIDLVLPLRSPEQIEGYIVLGRRESGAIFSAEDIEVLQVLASQVSVAVENARFYADLKRSREIIQRSDRLSAIGTMAAGLAHEIRNPLVSIRTFTQLLPERIEDEEFRDTFLDLTLSEVDRICLLINELLAFARPAPAELQSIDLNDCLERICLLLDNQARAAAVVMEFEGGSSLPVVTADEDQVKQVVMNVILNAIQACDQGGQVRIATRTSDAFDEPRVAISISDDGRGIEQERLAHIFDPFYTTRREGTGLGLSIAHQIISRHGGSIDVDTEPGNGTTFTISLPTEPPAGAAIVEGTQPFEGAVAHG